MDGAETLEIAATWLVSTLVPLAIIRRDASKLAAAGDAHPWNAATTGVAVVFFQWLALPAHYWALRRPRAAVVSIVAIAALLGLLASLPDG